MLLCDNCEVAIHIECLDPPLKRVPAGTWVCPGCVERGVSIQEVESRELRQPEAETKFLTRQQRDLHRRADELHGKRVHRVRHRAGTMQPARQYRSVSKLGGDNKLPRMQVQWDDGSVERLTVPQAEQLARSE